MEIKIKVFLVQERFQWSGGDANQLFNLPHCMGQRKDFYLVVCIMACCP